MSLWKDGRAKLLKALREARTTDTLGSTAAVVGVVLVISGIGLQESHGVEFGAAIRALGGILLLGGLGSVLFGEPRRRAAIINTVRRISERYFAVTANWRWTAKWGMSGVVTGLILLVPALVIEIIFGAFGAAVIGPGILLFWGGIALIVGGELYHRGVFRGFGSRKGSRPASRTKRRP